MIQLWFEWVDSTRLDSSCYPRPRQRKRSETASTLRLADLLGIHRSGQSPGHNRWGPERLEHPGPAHPEQHRLDSFGHVHAEWCLWPLQRPQGKSAHPSGSWTRALAPLKVCPVRNNAWFLFYKPEDKPPAPLTNRTLSLFCHNGAACLGMASSHAHPDKAGAPKEVRPALL